MVTCAYMFPGQGAQFVGMGRDLYEAYPAARAVFDRAGEVLKDDVKKLCFEGPKEELFRTANCQPAIVVASIAALKVVEEAMGAAAAQAPGTDAPYEAAYSLGLSLGEYTALAACGSITFEDALVLVKKRGEYMEQASVKTPGKMACVIGMEQAAVEELCKGLGCEIANLNCPGQIVISGKAGSVDLFASLAKDRGAKRVLMLEVSGPFHSSLMTPARDKLQQHIDKVTVAEPRIRFVSNVDGEVRADPGKIKENLVAQVNSKTLWEKSVRTVAAAGVKTFLEIGPGSVLKGLLKKIDPSLEVRNLGTVQEIQGFFAPQQTVN